MNAGKQNHKNISLYQQLPYLGIFRACKEKLFECYYMPIVYLV